MLDVIYNVKEEMVFDSMVAKLGDMTEQEKQHFLVLLKGYQAGIQVGIRLAANELKVESA